MVLPATLDPTGPLDDSMGVFYIGMLFSAVLYGFCILQAFIYLQKYARDPWYIKAAVITLIAFNTIHLILVAMGVYHYVISNYHDPSKLQDLTWPILMEAALVIANSTIVQVFYIYRVWGLSKRKITFVLLCGFFFLLVCGEVGAVITWLVLAMKMTKFLNLGKIVPLATAILCLSCSIDVLIAGTLCILLHRARTGFKHMDSIINRLILFVISTGLLTSIFAIAALICLFSTPYSLAYGALYQCLGHLYTNSFLTTLNRRSTGNHVDEAELKSRHIKFRIDTNREAALDKTAMQRMAESIMATKGRSVDSGSDFPARKGHFLGDLS